MMHIALKRNSLLLPATTFLKFCAVSVSMLIIVEQMKLKIIPVTTIERTDTAPVTSLTVTDNSDVITENKTFQDPHG